MISLQDEQCELFLNSVYRVCSEWFRINSVQKFHTVFPGTLLL